MQTQVESKPQPKKGKSRASGADDKKAGAPAGKGGKDAKSTEGQSSRWRIERKRFIRSSSSRRRRRKAKVPATPAAGGAKKGIDLIKIHKHWF